MPFCGSHLFSSEIISNDFLVDKFKYAKGGLPKQVLWKGGRKITMEEKIDDMGQPN